MEGQRRQQQHDNGNDDTSKDRNSHGNDRIPIVGLTSLPEELLYRILTSLRWFHLLMVSGTCKLLRRLADDDELWYAKYRERWDDEKGSTADADADDGANGKNTIVPWKERFRLRRHDQWASLSKTFVEAHPKDKATASSIDSVIRFFEDEGIAGHNDWTGIVKYLFSAQFGGNKQTSRIHDRGGLPLAPKEVPLTKRQIAFLFSSHSLCNALMDMLAPMFVGVHLEDGLRTVFTYVFPSSSTQLRDTLKAFAQAYYEANLGGEAALQLPSAEVVYLLCNCALMLSTDRHSGLVSSKMKVSEFIASCRRCVGLETLPEETLSSIYSRIQKGPPLVTKQSAI